MVDIKILTAVIFTIASATSVKIPNVQTKLQGQDAIAFTSLLQNLLNVNKERMDSLKSLVKKQELPAYHQRFGRTMRSDLERDSDDDDSDSSGRSEGPDVVAYLVLPQGADLRSSAAIGRYSSEDEDSSSSDEPGMTIENKNALRKSEDESGKASLRSCSSRSVKRCRRACREATSNACATYSCKRKLKSSLKRECKRACKSEFKRGYRYDTDDDW